MSTTRDLERLLRGMAGLFKNRDTLDLMRKAAVPVGEEGISYGMGIFRVDLGGGLGELWGHDGHGNSFAYYWPERGLFFTGTLNQTKNDWWPLVEPFFQEPRPAPSSRKKAGRSKPRAAPDGTASIFCAKRNPMRLAG